MRVITVSVDGIERNRAAQTCGRSACPLSLAWTLNTSDYSTGQHTVHIDVVDDAGNVATDDFLVYFAGPTVRLPPDTQSVQDASQLRVDGASAGDNFGSSVIGVDDVNGDSRTDFVVGAPGSSPGGRNAAGGVYVIYGSSSPNPRTLDLAALSPSDGFLITGGAAGERAGTSLAAGDFNGDSVRDLAIGAPGNGTSLLGLINRPVVYVLFGPLKASDSLAALGTKGYRVLGPSTDLPNLVPVIDGTTDLLTPRGFGTALSAGAGGLVNTANVDDRSADVNGDGRDDLVIGNPVSAQNARPSSGSAYVIFGQAGSADIDAGNLAASGFRIDGAATQDLAGYSVAITGDVNDDGYAEVAVGAPAHQANGVVDAGAGYLVYGTNATSPIDLAAATWNGYTVTGAPGDRLGLSTAAVGDMNNDGRNDAAFAGRRVIVPFSPGGVKASIDARSAVAGLAVAGVSRSFLNVNELGDDDHDGLPDLLVGDSSANTSYLVLGSDTPATVSLGSFEGQLGRSVTAGAAASQFGATARGVGPATGRFEGDSVVGAPMTDANGRTAAGSAWLLPGTAATTCYDRFVPQSGDAGAVVTCANGDNTVTVTKPGGSPEQRQLPAAVRAAGSPRNRQERGDTAIKGVVNSNGTEWVVRRTYVGAVINTIPSLSKPIRARFKARIRLSGNTSFHYGYIKPQGAVEQEPDFYATCRQGVGPSAPECPNINPVFKGGTFYSIFGGGVSLEGTQNQPRNMRGPGRFYWSYRLTAAVRPDGAGGQVLSVDYSALPRVISRPYRCAQSGSNQCLFRKPRS